jgi:3',5'-cyclic-nucleotide phosphodiesterase
VFPLHDEAVIGRDPQDALASDQYICVPEQTISRRHARIRRRGARYFVEDLHSRNGTFVLGERLAPGAWHALHDGDELALASAQLVFHSLLLPERGDTPTLITRSVDATQFAPAVVDIHGAVRSDLEKTVHRLHAMAQASIALGAVTDQATLIEKIMNFIFELFPLAERAFIMLRNNQIRPCRSPRNTATAHRRIRRRCGFLIPSSTKCCTRSARSCRSIPCPTAISRRMRRSSSKPSSASCACR